MRNIFTLLLLTASMLNPVAAQSLEYIDSVIAIVEDDVITNKELFVEAERIREEFRGQGRRLPSESSLNRQVLELMINKSILYQEANSRGVKITDTQLNTTLQDIAKRNKLTLAKFREALISQGMDYNKFRDNIRRELAISRIQNSYANQNVDISEQEVDDFLQRNRDGSDSQEFRLSHILLALPDGANSAQVSEVRSKIQSLAEQLKAGESFAELASTHSAGGTALQGGDLGWRKMAEIPTLFAGVVPNMQKGDVSEPLRSASGFHLIQLNDSRDAEQVLISQTHARHILIKEDELTSSEQARKKLETIREQIIQGAEFADLAKQYSEDPGSKGLGGDLGWFGENVMVDEFNQVLKRSEIGDTSEVFRSDFGWHVLQVLGRRTVDETEESKRNKIRAQLQNQKKQEVLELWQRRLRDQAFVKIIDA